jgi:hypothetical protein
MRDMFGMAAATPAAYMMKREHEEYRRRITSGFGLNFGLWIET